MTDTGQGEISRLVVELNSESSRDLNWLSQIEGLNKTTVVNRAVQVYRLVLESQRNGVPVVIGEQRVVII